jgi:hypothetical protein
VAGRGPGVPLRRRRRLRGVGAADVSASDAGPGPLAGRPGDRRLRPDEPELQRRQRAGRGDGRRRPDSGDLALGLRDRRGGHRARPGLGLAEPARRPAAGGAGELAVGARAGGEPRRHGPRRVGDAGVGGGGSPAVLAAARRRLGVDGRRARRRRRGPAPRPALCPVSRPRRRRERPRRLGLRGCRRRPPVRHARVACPRANRGAAVVGALRLPRPQRERLRDLEPAGRGVRAASRPPGGSAERGRPRGWS